jgi:phosphoglycerate dehydrogenase-like enzyme
MKESSMSKRPVAAIILGAGNQERIYPTSVRRELDALCAVRVEHCSKQQVTDHAEALSDVQLLFSGWGPPRLDTATLALMPRLEAVFYGAGSLNQLVCDDFWQRNVVVCSAWAANAVPVAEFTFAHIVLGLKQAQRLPELQRQARTRAVPDGFDRVGAYDNTVAIISLGQIGRRVVELLRHLDVRVLAYDPFCSVEQARQLGVELVDLETCFRDSRVVSLHTPWLPETEGLITGELLEQLPPGGVFINTARGAVVREDELIACFQRRPDLSAVLDVTYPEPPAADSPLYDLSNVFLTPHIAGSVGTECARMGHYMVDECRRFLDGEPLHWQVSQEAFARMA